MVIFLVCAWPTQALIITEELEVIQVLDVGSTAVTVTGQNSYTDLVVVCTYALPSDTDNEAVVRIDGVSMGSNTFDVRIQRPENGADVTAGDVYCILADEGDWTLPAPDGRVFEAHTVLSDGTNGLERGWTAMPGVNGAEDVSADIDGTYPANSQPVVLGQVMTSNDDEFSAFWSFDCDNRPNVPFQTNLADGICVGKHVGEVSMASGNDRANETLGYLVIAEGASPTGSFGGIEYRVALGGNSIRGVGNSPAYSYNVADHYEFGVATKEAENGGHGGWAVLYGTDPLAGNNIDLAIDEETVDGDSSRRHISEQVGYWLFSGTDRGDAPASYMEASHKVTGTLSIGPLASGDPDADADDATQFSAAADADDTALSGMVDDEDGVVFRSPAGGGDSIFADIEVNNFTGADVTLCAWLDTPTGGGVPAINNIFDSSEAVCIDNVGTGTTTQTVEWPNLPDNAAYTTFARFRLSSDALTSVDATSATTASDGEVEDYQITFDFTPTAVTIGDVGIENIAVADLLAILNVNGMSRQELLSVAQAWVPVDVLDSLETEQDIIDAISDYLDPDGNGQVVSFYWDTLEQRGTIGFYLERRQIDQSWSRVNEQLLPAMMAAPMGAEYQLLDPAALPANSSEGGNYQYRLIELEVNGELQQYGPFELQL